MPEHDFGEQETEQNAEIGAEIDAVRRAVIDEHSRAAWEMRLAVAETQRLLAEISGKLSKRDEGETKR